MEENKKILELLQSIEKTNRQQAKLTRLLCILALIAAIFCGCTFGLIFAILPDVNEIIPQISTVASQMQSVLSDLEQATRQLSVMDFTGMVEDVDTLVTTAQESLKQTMDKLNTIDFQTLNKAIDDLAAVVEPLSRVLRALS